MVASRRRAPPTPPSLCQGLEAFFRLVPIAEPITPSPGSADRRALYRRLRLGNAPTRHGRERGFDDRTAPVRHQLELFSTRYALSGRTAHRHRDGRNSQHARLPYPPEGSDPSRRFCRQAGDARSRHLARSRDRAMLLIGFVGGLRRSEIVGLDCGRDQTLDGRGWIEILDKRSL
ncbi:hypothetical protein ACVMH6_000383 [Rhizobium leguminosarum]